jgi:hypothetical protein
MVSITSIGKLIEGALEGDIDKVITYAQFIITKLEAQGEFDKAKIIRSKLDGSYKTQSTVTLD